MRSFVFGIAPSPPRSASVAARTRRTIPTAPITLVVPYAAGGGNDVMARIVGEKMSQTLGQQIVIDNRPGAGGALATRQVAKAAPDGYTLVIGGTGSLAVNPTLLPNVGYDVRKDFAPVGMIGSSAMIVLIHPSIPAKTIPELIALAKKEPGKFNYASAGVGSGIHLGAELFALHGRHQAGACPLQGHRPGADRSARRSRLDVFLVAAVRDRPRQGRQGARARRHRRQALRRLPGCPDGGGDACPASRRCCATASWRRPGTPRPIIDKLNAALRQALAEPDTIARMARDGTDRCRRRPEEYAADIDREERKWSEVVKRSGAACEVASARNLALDPVTLARGAKA